jgi:ABC-2 type transport system permease protein
MKTIDIALKDLKHIFKNAFSLVMMFGAPLLITGLLYFAFGGLSGGKSSFNMPVTKVQIVNLDLAQSQSTGFAAGQMLVDFLSDKSLADVLQVSLAPDEASAMAAVDGQKAGVAIIIPADFTSAVTTPEQNAQVVIYQDPTLTIGPGIVRDLVNHLIDSFSGGKIASKVALEKLSVSGASTNPMLGYQIVQAYSTWVQENGHSGDDGSASRLLILSPGGTLQTSDQGQAMIGPIMAGMLIFFVFFMGANSAESIINEDEQGTLARMFSTPTGLTAILGGKFLGVVVTLAIQIAVLLVASSLLFSISWGQMGTVLLISTALVIGSAGFGVMLMSFIRNSRQTGPVLGGVMTLMGMLGGLFTVAIPNIPAAFGTLNLVTPHGWALQGWKLAQSGAGVSQTIVPALVLIGMGFAFLAVGTYMFRKRFA